MKELSYLFETHQMFQQQDTEMGIGSVLGRMIYIARDSTGGGILLKIHSSLLMGHNLPQFAYINNNFHLNREE